MYDQIPKLGFPLYETCLFQAMFLSAFYFALRVGEFTSSRHNILRQNLTITNDAMHLTFLSYKYSNSVPETHTLVSNNSRVCPVKAMLSYLSYRGKAPGPLFLLNNKPVSRKTFVYVLNKVVFALKLEGLDLKPHSFRIGAASHWANKGFSEIQIRNMGRWHSNAYLNYIRGNVMHSSH